MGHGVRLLLTLLVIASAAVSRAEAATAYAIMPSGTEIVRFDTSTPLSVTQLGTVSGLQAGDVLIDLDVRPSNGLLYALGVNNGNSTARIYRIAPPITAGPIADAGPTATVLAGSQMAFTGLVGAMDFDPVNDRLRVVSASGQSYAVTPSEPAIVTPNAAVAGTTIVGLASTNNFNRPTAATLFGIDSGSGGRLVRIGAANTADGGATGTVTPIAAISGATVDTFGGFDISPNTAEAFVLVQGAVPGASAIYRIDLVTGAATPLGDINVAGRLKGLAVYARASLIYGVNTLNQLVIFLSAVPNDLRTAAGDEGGTARAITGLTGNVVGLDTRPSTGELFALTDANQIYRIDPVTAAATPVHALTGGTLSGAAFGMYFEPGSPEKIRLISNTGQNLEIDPDSGAVTALGTIAANVTAISAAPVALYGIDSATDAFVSVQPTVPQVFSEFPLGLDTTDLTNLDVAPADGSIFASVTVAPGTSSELFVINPTMHFVMRVGLLSIGGGQPLRAMAVASQGFVRLTPPTTYNVIEGPLTPAPVQIERYGGTDGPLSVEVRTWDGTAVAGTDYNAPRTTYNFLPGGALSVSPVAALTIDNVIVQPDRTINVGVIPSSLYQPATASDLSTGVITIHDDDALKNPTIQITSPTADPTYTAGALFVALAGNASDPDGTVQSVTWSSNRGFSGGASGTTDWIINVVQLVKGVNTITVTATDNDGRTSTDTIVITVNELTYYLAEGATSTFFTTDILLANPNDQPAPFTIQFLNEQGPMSTQSFALAPQSRKTIRVNDMPGMAQAGGISTIITSTDALPIIVERTMMWDQRGYGSATDHASDGVAPTWYFAEGAQGFFRTYLLLANPREGNNVAHVRYLRDNEPVFTFDYPLTRYQRFTVDIGSHPELRTRTFGIEVTFDQPGVAERAMYFGSDPLWLGGHESGGATSLSRSWFLAEGATGSYFKTYILLANPSSQEAHVNLDFLPSFGAVIHTTRTVPPNERRSVDISGEDLTLRNAAVATRVTSDVPIVVERAQYWPGGPDTWQETHNSFGLTEAGTKWGLAEGRIGMAAHYQPYILVANPGATEANVTIRFLRDEASGSAPFSRTFKVAPNSRFTVFGDQGVDTSPLRDENFGAVLTSDQPIVVERALYSDALGIHWQAGSNATATRLPVTVP